MEVRVGDKLKIDLEDGTTYDIIVVNINNFRPPKEKYGIDLWDENGTYFGDVVFVGQDFMDKCYYGWNY